MPAFTPAFDGEGFLFAPLPAELEAELIHVILTNVTERALRQMDALLAPYGWDGRFITISALSRLMDKSEIE